MTSTQSLVALEAFLLNNPQLEQLEGLLDSFNIFEAVGMVRQEVRHSHLLSLLLDPQQNHGLGDRFLKRFLQRAIGRANQPQAISAVELAVTDLSGMRVQREWHNIDIFLCHDAEKLAVIIENKVDSAEHSNQLARYWRTAEQHFPDWRILALFLTPDGVEPSDERFIAVDYGLIAALLAPLTVAQTSTLSLDVQTLIRHYLDMLQRHIMTDTEIADLCRRIYAEHKQALDLIFEHRPDVQSDIHDHLVALIEQSDEWLVKWSRKSYIQFRPISWKGYPYQTEDATNLLTFDFYNDPGKLRLAMTLNGGVLSHRQQMLDLAIANPKSGFRVQTKSLNKNWNRIYSDTWLSGQDYDNLSFDEIVDKLNERWQRFNTFVWPKLAGIVEPQFEKFNDAQHDAQ